MKVASIEDSLHFPGRAVVITGDCGHKHVRPFSQPHRVGDEMYCLFCDDTGVPPSTTKPPTKPGA